MRPVRLMVSALRRIRALRLQEKREQPLFVGEVAKSNTRDSYELIYGRDDLLAQYLEPGRIAFYEEVADYCVQLFTQHQSPQYARVVDVGCGTGHLLFSLWQRLRPSLSVQLWGIDYAPSGVRRAKELLPQSKLLVADIYSNPLPSGYFDLVLCTETLEHLDRPDKALSEILRICTRPGRAVITVPNGETDHWDGHVNFWTASEFRAFLSPYGPCEITLVHDDRVLRATLLNRR